TVERGQTIYRIAKTYGVDVRELMRLNAVRDPSQLEVGQKIFIPRPAPAVRPAERPLSQSVERLVGRKYSYSNWKTITVHHSGTKTGSAEGFHRDHLRRRMGGLFYHFVIGNGTKTRDGQIEVGFRWQRQVKANRPYDIQICLVGDFSEDRPSEAQFESLVELITVLRRQYDIPLSSIRTHGKIPGKHTECPGKNFPFDRLIARLAQEN
ncbi:MAG TPA: N-acetylmuramoyl-L-alanine amidase, partial [Candidatus Eisenbacteria bacterium]|nr:N-acetylmuramoyl-L-alanine amidase [Candidatus Eisenbacteria bacterium]